MSIEERIAEIVVNHHPDPTTDGETCMCGWDPARHLSADTYEQHVARVLTTELELTEEHAIGLKHPPFGRPGSLIDQDHLDFQGAREAAAASQDLTEYTRYVTPWENA